MHPSYILLVVLSLYHHMYQVRIHIELQVNNSSKICKNKYRQHLNKLSSGKYYCINKYYVCLQLILPVMNLFHSFAICFVYPKYILCQKQFVSLHIFAVILSRVNFVGSQLCCLFLSDVNVVHC